MASGCHFNHLGHHRHLSVPTGHGRDVPLHTPPLCQAALCCHFGHSPGPLGHLGGSPGLVGNTLCLHRLTPIPDAHLEPHHLLSLPSRRAARRREKQRLLVLRSRAVDICFYSLESCRRFSLKAGFANITTCAVPRVPFCSWC